MLTYVQKETLQTLVNLFLSSNGKPIKGSDIAENINRNPGTIRNQMIYLRRLGFVKSAIGPDGGYIPTMEAFHSLNISVSDNDCKVPIYKDGKRMEDASVARIEFTGVAQLNECEVAIRTLGSIKDLGIGDDVLIGPTPVNNLCVAGTIVGYDDLENILLMEAKTIRSIPKKTLGDIASYDVTSLSADCTIREAAKILAKKGIVGAPVIRDEKIIGAFTSSNLVEAIVKDKIDSTVEDFMSTNAIIVYGNMKLAYAIELMINRSISIFIIDDRSSIGIVTKADLMDNIVNLKQLPITNSMQS